MTSRRRAPRSHRIAILELNNYHDEVIPSFVRVLNECGFGVDVFTTKENARFNAFCLLGKESDYRIFRLHTATRLLFLTPFFRAYTAVFLNTIQPYSHLDYARRVDAPLFFTIHNADTALSAEVQEIRTQKDVHLVTLASHVSRTLEARGVPSLHLLPVYLGTYTDEKRSQELFIIQGAFVPQKRNYSEVVDILERGTRERERPLNVLFVGRSSDKAGRDFKDQIARKGLGDVFRFSRAGGISYPKFYDHLLHGTFILPLIDRSLPSLAEYYDSTISTSMTLAVALGLIPVVERDYARLYGMEQFAVTYQTGDLRSALLEAVRMNHEEVLQRQKAEALFRESVVAETARRFGDALSSLERKRGPSSALFFLLEAVNVLSFVLVIFLIWLAANRSLVVAGAAFVVGLLLVRFYTHVVGYYHRFIKRPLARARRALFGLVRASR